MTEESKEKDKNLVCLICGGPMELELHDTTSYFQCEREATHRMTLSEFTDLVRDNRQENEIRQSMEERALNLERQKKIQSQIDELQSELNGLQTKSVS